MTKLPQPPDPEALRTRAPFDDSLRTVDGGTLLWRIHNTVGPHILPWNQPRFYGPGSGRFDPHELPAGESVARSVLYLAADTADTALAEVFQRTRRVDIIAGGPYLTALRFTRPVTLLDLAGPWPTRAGASQVLCSGPRPRARAWARTIVDAWPNLEGLWYPSSMLGPGRCIALFTAGSGALPATPELSMPLAHPDLWAPLAAMCERIGYRLG